ncbi:MAG: helix-turn-helix transcriptional regulator [Candidatus Thermoplasmatota archaeon]|nr:helix-turn-helix transcriptional regulator [Candidatus Thermoplasmatota archaeon]
MQPLRDVGKTASNYLRLTGLLLDHGGLTPDIILPEVKDPISKEIIRALIDRTEQNISQITERVRNKRGTASRRTIRKKMQELTEKKIVKKHQKGSIYVYALSEEVVKNWSQMLGFNI